MREEKQSLNCYEWISKQQYTSAKLMAFNKSENKWEPYDITKQSHTSISQKQHSSKLSTLTINVLTDCTLEAPLKRNILFSADRYAYILQYISTVQPHVITFNQATHNFYTMLIQCQWVQDKYWVSQFNHKQSDGSFNVIMCRVQPLFLRAIKITNLSRQILTLYLSIGGKIVTISCAHLTSLAGNIERRRNQLTQLTKLLQNYKEQKDKKIQISHIIQGDLNIHSQTQNTIFSSLNLIDSWIECHRDDGMSKQQVQKVEEGKADINKNKQWQQVVSSKPGYTFDGEVNSMIKQVYWGFEARRMRLDRVVHSRGVRCRAINVILNQPMYKEGNGEEYPRMGAAKGVFSLLFDIVGYNAFRTKEKYLFPSDHFGLLTQFEIDAVVPSL